MKTDTIKFSKGRSKYTLTRHFADRVLHYYTRRSNIATPTELFMALRDSGHFSKAVNAKVRELVRNEQLGNYTYSDEGDQDADLHAAFKRFAAFFELPEPPTPKCLKKKPEPPELPKAPPTAPTPTPKPEDEEDEQDEEKGKDGEGEGDGVDGDEQDGPPQGATAKGDADSDEEGEDEGEGDGESEGGESGDGEGGGSTVGNPDAEQKEKPAAATVDLIEVDEARGEIKNKVIDGKRNTPIQSHPISPITGNHQSPNRNKLDTSFGNQLMARMRNELMGVQRHRHTRDKDSGEVDLATKLTDLATATNLDRAYYTVTAAKRLNAAVQIIIDVSSSMGSTFQHQNSRVLNSMIPAVQCSLLMAECLERLRIPIEIRAFNEMTWLVKGWNEKFSMTEARIRSLCGYGSTNLPNAMQSGLKSLGPRKESRHVQIVITDGDIGRTHQCVEIQKQDPKLRTYAFGIGTYLPGGVFYKCVSNMQQENIVDTIVEQLREALIPR